MTLLCPWRRIIVLCVPHNLERAMHAVNAVHDAREWVVAGITAERAISGSVKAATAAAARWFGITPRRAASYWWDQVTFLGADEYLRIREGHYRRLKLQRLRAEAEIASLDALIAKAEASYVIGDQVYAGPAPLPHVAGEAHPQEARDGARMAG
jgi:hypothetical protein